MSGKFIVVFKDTATQQQIDEYAQRVNSNGGKVGHRYHEILKGFSAEIPDNYFTSFQDEVNGVIDYIEPDGVVTTQ